jgi:hypothetical protein
MANQERADEGFDGRHLYYFVPVGLAVLLRRLLATPVRNNRDCLNLPSQDGHSVGFLLHKTNWLVNNKFGCPAQQVTPNLPVQRI